MLFYIYIDKVQSSITSNMKSFWSFVISKRKNIDIPNTESRPSLPAIRQTATLVEGTRVTREELINAIQSMKKSSGFGPD